MKILIITLLFFQKIIYGLKQEYINYAEEEDIAIISLNFPNNYSKTILQIFEDFDSIIDNININQVKALIIINKDEEKNYFINGYNNILNNEITKKGNELFSKIETLPILVIAIINGNCFGFGFELSLSCDIRICSENSFFGFKDMNKDIIPSLGGTQRLNRIINNGIAKQIIYTRQKINSEEALRIKLINAIYPENDLLNYAIIYVKNIKKNSHIINKGKSDYILFQIRIKYNTKLNENIYIYGNNTDFGNWKKPKFKLHWSSDHIWQSDYAINKNNNNCIEFKFVCHSDIYDKWEEGYNRLLCPHNLKGLNKTNDGKYILDFIWNHFKINFNIHYTPPNDNTYIQISGSPLALTNWQHNGIKPLKMELDNNKELLTQDGNNIKGFWTLTVILRTNDINNFNFEYRYSLFDEEKNNAMWEREPNRHIHIFTNEKEFYKNLIENKNNNKEIDSYYLLTNSFLEILDVNFVSDLVFDKMGDKNIFIGPYPQSKNDFKKLYENGINAILNIQTDKDMKIRQINHQLQIEEAKKYGISIYRYPIEDFNQIDLYNKLKGAGDLLNELIKEGKIIYVHCTAGMSRAAATVIIYLVLHENYSVEEANNYCKKYRPIICPNYGVINKIASEYKPGFEMKGIKIYNFES